MTRHEVLEQACEQCLKELYTKVQPAVTWEDFIGQNKMYSNRYKLWEKTKDTDPEYIGKTRLECIGPAPYEFYYLPKDVFKDIADSYVHAYNIDAHQNLLDIIDILKNYCKDPIIDKYIEGKGNQPGYRGYAHPDNLEKELGKLFENEILKDIARQYNEQFHLNNTSIESSASNIYAKILQDKFFEFLDMAGKFYTWHYDLNSFNTTVYLGPSPCSNKERVIENWKIYRNEDITIDDSVYIEDKD